MAHDFNRFPELTNSQMELYYFESPHKQILEDFRAEVVKVHDGDTVTVRWNERDFDFPVRFLDINAKEMSEGGEEAKQYLIGVIEGEEVELKIDSKQRVGKYGRLLARVISMGMDIGEMIKNLGLATSFENRNEGKIPDLNKELRMEQWL